MRHPRWIIAAAVAVVAAVASVTVVQFAGASGGSTASTLVPIVPCRLVDTRPAPDLVGTRSAPIGPGAAVVFAVTGTNGNCAIPSGATGVATNVTVTNGTAASYLSVYPADAARRPLSANLNWTAGASPTPNQVTVGLSGTGAIAVYNFAGTVDVVIDIVGYYVAASAAGAGAAGPAGPAGNDGAPGPTGADGIVSMTGFAGRVSNTTVLTTDGPYVFLGPTARVAVGSGERIVGSASASIGRVSGTADLAVALCLRAVGSGSIVANSTQLYVDTVGRRNPVSVSTAVNSGPGTFDVGLCAYKQGTVDGTSVTLDDNDYVTGFVLVTR